MSRHMLTESAPAVLSRSLPVCPEARSAELGPPLLPCLHLVVALLSPCHRSLPFSRLICKQGSTQIFNLYYCCVWGIAGEERQASFCFWNGTRMRKAGRRRALCLGGVLGALFKNQFHKHSVPLWSRQRFSLSH